jgi:hypothetical protein
MHLAEGHHYLELILKADRLMTYLEALRLSGAIGTGAYDHQVAVAVRDLVAVPRSAFHLAIALRKRAARLPATPAKAAQPSKGSAAKEGRAPDPPASPATEAAASGVAPAGATQPG